MFFPFGTWYSESLRYVDFVETGTSISGFIGDHASEIDKILFQVSRKFAGFEVSWMDHTET